MLVYVKCDKTLRCGCNPGYWTQSSNIPFRHKHVRVALPVDSPALSERTETEPCTDAHPRVLGGTAARFNGWLERHRLTAYPKGLSKRERRALGV